MEPTSQRPQPVSVGAPQRLNPPAARPAPPMAAPRPAPGTPVQRAPGVPPKPLAAPGSAFRGAAPPSVQNKFKPTKKNSSREYYDTTSFYKAAEAKQDAEEPVVSLPRPRTKSQIGSQVRRAVPGVLGRTGQIGPVLDSLVGDGRASGELGRQAGLPELPHGGGLLGAIARRAGIRLGSVPVALDRTDKPLAPAVPSQSFLQKSGAGLRPAPMLSAAPRAATPPVPVVVGHKKLSEVLRQAAGRVGDLLFNTDLGAQFLAIENMQDALRGRSSDLLQAQKLQPTWG